MKIIGITRYSLVTKSSLGSYKATRGKSLDDAKRIVLDPARLAYRADLFRRSCLRSINAMIVPRDVDYKHWIVTSQGVDVPEIGQHVEVIHLPDDADIRDLAIPSSVDATFRIDDDDVLHPAYLAYLRTHMERPQRETISFASGIYVSKNGYAARKDVPNIAIGQARLGGNVYALGNHMAVDSWVIQTKRAMWLRVVHKMNDSGVRVKRGPQAEAYDELDRQYSHIWPSLKAFLK